MINTKDILETIKMIEEEHLDIRTITMGISLRDLAADDINVLADKVYDKVTRRAEKLVATGEQIERELGIPIINKRISVTPIAMVGATSSANSYVPLAKALDRAAETTGVNFVGGFSALVQKGFAKGDEILINSIPEAMAETNLVCSSVNVASTKAGVNLDAIGLMGRIIKQTAELTKDNDSMGCSKLVVFAKTELRARLFAARCKDFPAHRSAGQDDLFAAAEQLFRLLEADQHAVGLFREHLRDLAGEGVDLKQHGRDVKLLRRLDHREGGIAAAADHAVRTRLAQHLFRLCDGGNRELRRLEVVHDALRAHRARQADDLDRVERIALARHQLVLDAACRTGKAHDRIRLTLLEISCNGKAGRYVAARSSAGNIKSHRKFSPSRLRGRRNLF